MQFNKYFIIYKFKKITTEKEILFHHFEIKIKNEEKIFCSKRILKKFFFFKTFHQALSAFIL